MRAVGLTAVGEMTTRVLAGRYIYLKRYLSKFAKNPAKTPKIDQKIGKNIKFSELGQTHPNASVCIRTYMNASEQVRMDPNRSEQDRKLRKTCENFEKLANLLRQKGRYAGTKSLRIFSVGK